MEIRAFSGEISTDQAANLISNGDTEDAEAWNRLLNRSVATRLSRGSCISISCIGYKRIEGYVSAWGTQKERYRGRAGAIFLPDSLKTFIGRTQRRLCTNSLNLTNLKMLISNLKRRGFLEGRPRVRGGSLSLELKRRTCGFFQRGGKQTMTERIDWLRGWQKDTTQRGAEGKRGRNAEEEARRTNGKRSDKNAEERV